MTSCSSLEKYFHVPPPGVCKSAMKLCCLLNQQRQQCDKDFIVTSFERFCKTSSPKYEACCMACQIGVELAGDGYVGLEQLVDRLVVSSDEKAFRDLILQCAERENRQISNFKRSSNETCKPGFHWNSLRSHCQDLDECQIKDNGCYDTQECVNTIGSYKCIPRGVCKNGFIFDHVNIVCRKEVNPSDCGVVVNITMRDSNFVHVQHSFDSTPMESGSSKVVVRPRECPPGFQQNVNTTSCEDVDECRLKRHNCEHFCQNLKGSFVCHCRKGFREVNGSCVDIDECSRPKLQCSHGCRNTVGSFRCQCPKGFKLGINRRTCEDINECMERRGTCPNKICNNLIGSHACYEPTCPTGYKIYHFTRRNDYK